MKQFARCTNCRQWYMHSATLLVEIYRGNGLHRTTLWCVSCVRAAEQRSQSPGDSGEQEMADLSAAMMPFQALVPETHGSDDFHRLIQEHLDLMDRALQEDDSVIVSLIDDFMDRCRSYRNQLDHPDHVKRLSGHLQYWDTFLQALRQSS